MDLITAETIKGFEDYRKYNFTDDVYSQIGKDVEFLMREIIEDSTKFMRHAKRSKLINEDVMNALKLRNVRSIYGHLSPESLKYKIEESRENNRSYYVPIDKELKIDDLLNEPLPEIPYEITYHAHWLAINGIQPNIPENPVTEVTPISSETQLPDGSTHSISKELQAYYSKIISVLKGDSEEVVDHVINNLSKEGGYNQLIPYFIQYISNEIRSLLAMKIKPKEMFKQLNNYVRAIHSFVINPNNNLNSYLHQILPTILSVALGKKLKRNKENRNNNNNNSEIENDNRMEEEEEENEDDENEKNKRGNKRKSDEDEDSDDNEEENHFELRKLAVNLLFLICNQYKNTYPDLETRTVNTFKHIIDSDVKKYKSGPLYGALLGIRVFGSLAIQKVLVPKFNDIHMYLQTLDASRREGRYCNSVFAECIYMYHQYARANNLDLSILPNIEELPNPEYMYNVMKADEKTSSHLSDINI